MAHPKTPAETRYDELTGKVDDFFAQVQREHSDAMQCGAGCRACCARGLTVTRVEARAIARFVLAAGDGIEPSQGPGCAALDDAGRCRIYAARPLVCRSQGVPVRLPDPTTRLPVVTACELNFVDGFADIAPLDQTTLSTILAALEAAVCAETNAEAGTRYDIATLIADPAGTL